MKDDLSTYPVSHALALIDVRNALFDATKKVLALPRTPVDSVEQQAVKNQFARLLTALEERGVYNPVTEV